MTEPTDAELTEVYKAANGEDTGKAQPLTTKRIFRAMRAAIAKWGAPPAVAGEPVAWVDERAIGWLANSRSGAATITTTLGRQKSFERPMPLHTTPQPTQAQAGAVPLTPAQVVEASCVYWGKTQLRNAFEAGARFAEQHHGIKGGQ